MRGPMATLAMTCLLGCGGAGSSAPVASPTLLPVRPSGVGQRGADCSTEFGRPMTMTLDRARMRANGATPALLAKLDASAHRYSRLLAIEVAARTCLEFRDVRWHLPVVAIHGDAHLEQFASTPTTFGLEDFDEAGFGPAVVDLVRFATSIHLACREVQFECRAEDAVAAFFKAYRGAIDRPTERTLPAVASRMRARVPQDNQGWLAWADGLAEPLSPSQEEVTKKNWAAYITAAGDHEKEAASGFYDILRIGQLKMGVGSALESKLLFRVKGPTDSPDDDQILEARVASVPSSSACTYRPPYGGALYMLTFIAVLGSRMPHAFGTVTLNNSPDAHEFWVQKWEPGYTELALSDIRSQAELEELVVDGARQLAGYFWTRFPETLREHQRLAGLVGFDIVETRARALAKKLALETVAGWQKFRAAK